MLTRVGPLIIDVKGLELEPEEHEILQHPLVGGVILFTRNYADVNQLTALCKAIRKAAIRPILILVDQEGGRVQRFKEGFTRLPSPGMIGQIYEHSQKKAYELAKDAGWLMAQELLAVGIDMSFAPVLDLNCVTNSVVGDRAFHSTPAIVNMLAGAFVAGMQEAGMMATGKHFPGHGSVALDSHIDLPIDNRELSEIHSCDLQPFLTLMDAGLQAIMSAHIIFSKIDTQPVTFSTKWLQTILRQQYRYKGIVFSDDLNMQALNFIAHYAERAAKALAAGCDMILMCNNRLAVTTILDQLPISFVDETRFSKLRGNFTCDYATLIHSKAWQEKNKQLKHLTENIYSH